MSIWTSQLVESVLEAAEELGEFERERFLKQIMPALMDQDIHDEYEDWINEGRFPTFAKLYAEEEEVSQ